MSTLRCDMCGDACNVLLKTDTRTGAYCHKCIALIHAMEDQRRKNRMPTTPSDPRYPPSLPHKECQHCRKRWPLDAMYNDRFCKQCLIDHAMANRKREEAAAAPAPAGATYFTVQGCKEYVRKWLSHVSGLNASQPRHYLRQRALPPPQGETS